MLITTKGLVLREVSYKETDKILTVLTAEGGLRTVKARGCRRKNSPLAASAQLLVYSEMTLFEYQDYWSLNEASSLDQFWGIKSDVELLALGSYFSETMEAIAEEGRADPALLSLILNSLYALCKLQKPRSLVKAAYELRLMCLAGYEPQLDACAVCGAEAPAGACLNLSEGLLCCSGCRGGVGPGFAVPLLPQTLAALRYLVTCDPKRLFSFPIDPLGLQNLSAVSEAFLVTQLERKFRTLDFYKQIRLGG
ncbi:MAG: DNA repair protein RecO [Pseudoflavonifractor sp.]